MGTANNTTSTEQSAVVLGGVATILFGIAAVFWPALTLVVLLYLFSAYVIISGIVSIVSGISVLGKNQSGFLHIILGIFELGIGVYLIRHPGVTFKTFVLLIGLTLIAQGIIGIAVTAMDNALSGGMKILNFAICLLAIVAGFIVLYAKPAHGVTFVWILGFYALVVGTFRVAQISHGQK